MRVCDGRRDEAGTQHENNHPFLHWEVSRQAVSEKHLIGNTNMVMLVELYISKDDCYLESANIR